MFSSLPPLPEDKILGLMKLYRADERPGKIDLGVGVYKDATGKTPVMQAVKAAEAQLLELEDTKSYTSLAGDPGFHQVMKNLVLGDSVADERLAYLHTPGGTGAIRQIFEMLRRNNPEARLWLSNPTWPNHNSIAAHLGIETLSYRYLDTETTGVDFSGMAEDLAQARAGDVVLLHGCCHNPSGANLNMSQWEEIATLLESRGVLPVIDIAYQGFGDGLQEDAAATRLIARRFPEVLIAASCSKNFGIYRERTGIVIGIAQNAEHRDNLQSTLAYLNRQAFSFPPDHGARLVTMILQDEALHEMWQSELESVRLGMLELRQGLASALEAETSSNRFGFIAAHRGMFSRLGLTPEQVLALRKEHGIYMVGDSRINIAGLNQNSIPVLAKAVASVTA